MNKNTDIMVGDWVKIEDQEEDPLYNKGWLTTQVSDADDLADIIAEGWKPIPLTPEILDRIGFKDLWQTNGTVLQIGRAFINYDINNGYLFIMDGDEDLMDVRNIRYVHELQHALRLCGIKKEIKI